MPPDRLQAVFFDLDHTLLSRSSGELYIRLLRERGLLTRVDLGKIFLASILYRLNLLQPERLMERFAGRYRGEAEQEMIDSCREWFQDTVKYYLYEEAIQEVREHRGTGHRLALLTAATPYIAEPTARFLGIDSCLCTRMEVDHLGRFTGHIVKPICHGAGKLVWARHFCREHGLDLSESSFYTDSITDLPVLEAVKHPVAVNPDPFLLRVAKKKGWRVMRFQRTLRAEPSTEATTDGKEKDSA